MTSDYALSGEFGDQLSLEAELPVAGQAFKDSRSGAIVVVLTVRQDRRTWVTVRQEGEERELQLDAFRRLYNRCRPDGRLL